MANWLEGLDRLMPNAQCAHRQPSRTASADEIQTVSHDQAHFHWMEGSRQRPKHLLTQVSFSWGNHVRKQTRMSRDTPPVRVVRGYRA